MANKKGPLNKAEIFYLEEHYKMGKSIDEIAIDLQRAQYMLEKHISKNKLNTKTKNPMGAGEHFVRHRGATIMTENASTIGDAKRKSLKNTKPQSCVVKIKEDE